MTAMPDEAPSPFRDMMQAALAIEEHVGAIAPEIKRITREQALAVVRSPAFAAQVKEIVKAAAQEIVREVIAEDLPGLEPRVAAIVKENFDRAVAAAAHALLDEKLAEIRRRLT